MATILLTSLSGSPGVSTATLALAMNWPRPVLMIEADIARYSAVMPGYLRGQEKHSKGMGEIPVSVRGSAEGLTIHHLLGHSIGLDSPDKPLKKVVPGFRDPAAAGSWRDLWGQLGAAAATLEQSGADVLIDAGRWAPKDPRALLLPQIDQILVLATPDLPSLVAAHHRMPELQLTLESGGRPGDSLLVSPAATPHSGAYGRRETSKVLGVETTTPLEWDPRAAAIFSHGEPARKTFTKTKFGRSIITLQTELLNKIDAQRKLLFRDSEPARTR
ncbi:MULTISPECIES: hypothetical protein [unclassified Leucobacter]|uniref:hypothetical protein n=1 Tax=unclassified Leucobacter TaxID=2621730 RepID=UPI0030177378